MRYLCLSDGDRAEMLEFVGAKCADDFFPCKSLFAKEFNLPNHKTEAETLEIMGSYATKNTVLQDSFLGAGAYNHYVPEAVNHIIQRTEFLTSYTPYQPEVSQGTLQVIFEYQSTIARLTGMEIANASMYDGQTAAAEAILMAFRITKRNKCIITGSTNPDYTSVCRAYAHNVDGAKVEVVDSIESIISRITTETACVVVQFPNYFGEIEDFTKLREKCTENGALLVVIVNEILALGMLTPPEADIICGDASSLGMPLSFGGPTLGFFACKMANVRAMPGRVCGATHDEDGRRGFVLTLSAREQHIRREKATSNICSNQGLCAAAFTIHTTLLGEVGMKNLAVLNHNRATKLASSLEKIGITIRNKTFFNEFVYSTGKVSAAAVISELQKEKIFGGIAISENEILVCVTEMNSEASIARYAEVLNRNLAGK